MSELINIAKEIDINLTNGDFLKVAELQRIFVSIINKRIYDKVCDF